MANEIRRASVVYPFYQQHKVLERHLEVWRGLPQYLAQLLEFVIVDDGSPKPLPYLKGLVNHRQFRVEEDIPWNYVGAKNLGAVASRHPWMYYSDLDHLTSHEFFVGMLKLPDNPKVCYTFQRRNPAPEADPRYSLKPHNSTSLISRAAWCSVGGLDEDFAGHYGYDDTYFRMCLGKAGVRTMLADCTPLHNLSGNFEVEDADTVGLDRDDRRNYDLMQGKIAAGRWRSSSGVLRFPWKEVFE